MRVLCRCRLECIIKLPFMLSRTADAIKQVVSLPVGLDDHYYLYEHLYCCEVFCRSLFLDILGESSRVLCFIYSIHKPCDGLIPATLVVGFTPR